MEIRRVEIIKEKSYPKEKEITEKVLKSNTLEKWETFGITAFAMQIILSNKTFATEVSKLPIIDNVVAGGLVYREENPIHMWSGIISSCTFIIFILIALYVLIKKISSLKKKTKYIMGKKSKIACVISIILSISAHLIFLNTEYYMTSL